MKTLKDDVIYLIDQLLEGLAGKDREDPYLWRWHLSAVKRVVGYTADLEWLNSLIGSGHEWLSAEQVEERRHTPRRIESLAIECRVRLLTATEDQVWPVIKEYLSRYEGALNGTPLATTQEES